MRHESLYKVDYDVLEKSKNTKLSPERELMKAVLDDAIQLIDHPRFNGKTKYGSLHWEFEASQARRWMKSQEEDHCFAFVNVCYYLGLDPNAVRNRYIKKKS